MRASAILRADSTCGFGLRSFKINCFSISLSITGNWPGNVGSPAWCWAQPRTEPRSKMKIGFGAITELIPTIEYRTVDNSYTGSHTAHKISPGDCEAKREEVQGCPGRIKAYSSRPGSRPTLRSAAV